ncbi:MAG: T9SS type A sorting domain-containing protein [Chitinophagales bacterium]
MKLVYTFFALLFCTILSAQNITTTVIDPPAQLRCNEVPAKLNNVVFGAVPPNSANKPVVVYVHGWFDNGYAWFMAKNKWYENSYNQGYRTAFFFQSYSDAFEDNGKVIAQMIRKTCEHYNTNSVIAVCHSKGGYDMDYTLYNENLWDSVQGVITLSTPYYGAPIADLISFPIFKSILEIIPIVGPIFQGKGTYQMQTAYMAGVVRPMIDNHPNNNPAKFHCFAAHGFDHPTVMPSAIPDDILKVVFPNYRPACIDIPGFGDFAGNLMSTFMNITGVISKVVQVQDKYNNPSKNTGFTDGLAPYYSSLRPGSTVISQSPPAQQSYLNHIDVLLSSYAWNIVQPEIEYFKDHPTFRTSNPVKQEQKVEQYQPVSDVQLIQNKTININTEFTNKLFLVGEYKNESIKVYDDQNNLVKTIPLNYSVQAMYDIFHEISLSDLLPNKNYRLESSKLLTGLLQDGNNASIQLQTNGNKTYYSNDALGFEVQLNNWTKSMENTVVKGMLSRNMDENGSVVADKIIPVSFEFDTQKNVFVCKDKLNIDNGIYNIAVFAEAGELKRFATTSILLKQNKFNEQTNMLPVTVYPNPAKDILNIQFETTASANYTIEIFDIAGKKIAEKTLGTLSAGMQQIQLSTKSYDMAAGSYLISLTQNGECKNSKVIQVN